MFNLKATNVAIASVNVTSGAWSGRGVVSVQMLSSVLYRVTLEDDIPSAQDIAVVGVDGYAVSSPGVLDLSLSSPRDFSFYVARTLLLAVGVIGGGGAPPPTAQTAWFVNALTGSDTNPGTAAAPLRTVAEWHRRIGDGPIVVSMTVTLQTDIAEDLNLLNLTFGPNLVQPFLPVTLGGSVTFQGAPSTVLRSGTFTAVQLEVPGPGFPVDATITDAALPGVSWSDSGPAGSSLVNRVIVLIDRPFVGLFQPFGWVALDKGAKVARHSPFLDFSIFDQTPPLVGERYEVRRLTRWTGSIRVACDGGAGFPGSTTFQMLDLVTDTNNDLFVASGGVVFLAECSCTGFDVVASAGSQQFSPQGCFFDASTRVRANDANLSMDACLIKRIVELERSRANFGVENMFQGGTGLVARQGAFVTTFAFPGYTLSFFDLADAITLQPGTTADLQGVAWGTGVTNTGIKINSVASCVFNPALPPNIQTPGREVDAGGILALYGATFVNPGNHAIVTPRAF